MGAILFLLATAAAIPAETTMPCATASCAVERYVAASFPWTGSQVRIELTSPEPRASGPVSVLSSTPGRVVGPIAFQVAWGDRTADRAWVQANVHVRVEGPIAARDLTQGTVIADADLSTAVVELGPAGVVPRHEIVGRRVKRGVRAGVPVRSADVEDPEAVKAGDRLELRRTSGLLSIRSEAVALSGGGRGEVIRVRLVGARRPVEAVVESRHRAVARQEVSP